MAEVKSVKEFINFMLDSTDHSKEIDKLQKLLENTGVEAKIITKYSGENSFSYLNIVYDDEVVRTKKKRNAGRPFKGHVGRYTCGKIKEMQKSMTNTESAQKLKISERTLYRRLKDNINSPDDELFI